MYVIKEKIFINGEFADVKEVKRFKNKPENLILKKNQKLFKIIKPQVSDYDQRLAYPAAHGLSSRKGL